MLSGGSAAACAPTDPAASPPTPPGASAGQTRTPSWPGISCGRGHAQPQAGEEHLHRVGAEVGGGLDDVVEDLPLRAAGHLPLETAHHRVEKQETKCGFGLQGVCCRLCANGPCRITPDAPRGICGANADTIVARFQRFTRGA